MERIGPYERRRTLGRGGAAIVYEVSGARGEPLALKLLLRSSPAQLARFQRELELMRSLGEEAGFVPVLDAGQTPQGAYLVMPYLPAGSLEDRLRAGPLELLDAIDLAETLARALGRAHAAGLVHRDLKPGNVLFDGHGRALVSDLGLGKALNEGLGEGLSKTGELRGTLGYAPPEQLRDAKRAGPAADVFALGATLYHCLAGRAPFGHDLGVVERIELGASFAELEHVPGWLREVIARCLAPDPNERYPDGAALLQALQTAPRGETGRGRLVLAGLGGLALAGLVLLGLALGLDDADPDPAPPPTAQGRGRSPAASATPAASSTASPAPSEPTPSPPSPSPTSATAAPRQTPTRPRATPSALPSAPGAQGASRLVIDLAHSQVFEPVRQYGGSHHVQSARIAQLFAAPERVFALDAEGVLRAYAPPSLRALPWQDLRETPTGERVSPEAPVLVSMQPQGGLLFLAFSNGRAEVRAVGGGTLINLNGLAKVPTAAAFSAEGTSLLLAIDGTVAVVDFQTRKSRTLLSRAAQSDRVALLAAGAKDTFALQLVDGRVELWSAPPAGAQPRGAVLTQAPDAKRLLLSPRGRVAVVKTDDSLWVGGTGSPSSEVASGHALRARGQVLGWAWREGRDELVLVSDQAVWRVDATSGKVTFAEPLAAEVASALPSGTGFVYCTLPNAPNVLRVIDLSKRTLLGLPPGHLAPVVGAVDVEPERLASVGADLWFRGWEAGGKALFKEPSLLLPRGLVATGSGEQAVITVVAGADTAGLFTGAGAKLQGLGFRAKTIQSCARTATGLAVLGLSDGSVRVIDVGARAAKGNLQLFAGGQAVLGVCVTKLGVVGASAGELGFAIDRDRAQAVVPGLVPASLCADEERAYVGTSLGKLLVFEARSGRQLARVSAHEGGVTAAAIMGAHLVTGGHDRALAVWRFAEGKLTQVERVPLRHSGDRVSFLGAGDAPDELLIGTARGAIVRCRLR